MKDFTDLAIAARRTAFDGSTLVAAIRATFRRRGTQLPESEIVALGEQFVQDARAQANWKAYVKREGHGPAGPSERDGRRVAHGPHHSGRREPWTSEGGMNPKSHTTWTEIGALTTAGTVAATILCCLPFATGVIGAGAAAIGAQFAPVQPYLTATSLAFLAFAFYRAYRREPSCGDDVCAPPVVRRRRLAVWLVAVVVTLLLTVEWWANWVIYWTL